jgi:hypothetical protein
MLRTTMVAASRTRGLRLGRFQSANGASPSCRIRYAYPPAAAGDYPGHWGYNARTAFRRLAKATGLVAVPRPARVLLADPAAVLTP